MKKFCLTAVTVLSILSKSSYGQPGTLELKTATNHPMQYYLSLPTNWSPKEQWPVVIVFEEAAKQFKENAERFVNARNDMPFIIVAPFITTNGQHGQRDPAIYPYSTSVWDTIEKVSVCKFDTDGLKAVIKDVQKNYSGSQRVFITGFEAGAHLVWAMIFQHPELLFAAAPVAGNYRDRCVENNSFSHDESRGSLPIKNFTGMDDTGFGVHGTFYNQYLEAKKLAVIHGYKNISETEVKGKAHVPLPKEVLNYFYSIWQTTGK